MVVEVYQTFQLFRQNTWFHEINKALSKFFTWYFALLD